MNGTASGGAADLAEKGLRWVLQPPRRCGRKPAGKCADAVRLAPRVNSASLPRAQFSQKKLRKKEYCSIAQSHTSRTATHHATPEIPATLLTGSTLGGLSAINAAHWTELVDDGAVGWGVAGLDAAAARRAYARAARTVGAARPAGGLRSAYGDDWLAASARAGLLTVMDETGSQAKQGVWLHLLAVSRAGHCVDACAAFVAPALRGACAGRLHVRTGVTVTAVRLANGDGRRPRASAVDVVETKPGPAGWPRTLHSRVAVISST